jgi:Ca2+/Na+ antiporter
MNSGLGCQRLSRIPAGNHAPLVLGSRLLVEHCLVVARAFAVSDAVISLTIIAAGTSMPELATSVVAALRKQPDIAIGNVVGSNIFNVPSILGLSSLVTPLISAEGEGESAEQADKATYGDEHGDNKGKAHSGNNTSFQLLR